MRILFETVPPSSETEMLALFAPITFMSDVFFKSVRNSNPVLFPPKLAGSVDPTVVWCAWPD